MKKISVTELTAFACDALQKAGLSEDDAKIAADVLVTTDTFGVYSHGTKNLYQYILKMQAGGLDAHAKPSIEKEGLSWALVNGNSALGMLSAAKAMEIAIGKAKKTGIAYVGVYNSSHFGAAGYYANLAAQQNMIGLAMSNADPNMAIPGSCKVVIGNNPFSFAVPLKGSESIFLDIAMSNVAALKVVMAKEKGQSVPDSWLIDEYGTPTTDPSGFPVYSHLRPMAEHKGYGLALMVEVLAGVLTQANILSQVASWNLQLAEKNGVGHACIAIDIQQMLDLDTFQERMRLVNEEIKNAPKALNKNILLPGELEWSKRKIALQSNCMELNEAMADNLDKLAGLFDLKLNYLN